MYCSVVSQNGLTNRMEYIAVRTQFFRYVWAVVLVVCLTTPDLLRLVPETVKASGTSLNSF
jgi:hypothetical protein